MVLNFPLEASVIKFSTAIFPPIVDPLLSLRHIQLNEERFLLHVRNVASYLVEHGEQITVYPHKDADNDSVNLFLNGSVLGALLHQRAMLPFHGSTFNYNGTIVMICGNSGSGKSSVTAAFCQNGARFINDDITPVRITQTETRVIPIRTRIKLWEDSLRSLKINHEKLDKIRPSIAKFYIPSQEIYPHEDVLNHLIVLRSNEQGNFQTKEFKGMDKYNLLRHQIYRKSYLKGMPETEKTYFKQLLQMGQNVRVTQVIRPQHCNIYDLMEYIKTEILA